MLSDDGCNIIIELHLVSSGLLFAYTASSRTSGILLETRDITAITVEAAMQILDRLDHRPIPATILLSGHSTVHLGDRFPSRQGYEGEYVKRIRFRSPEAG